MKAKCVAATVALLGTVAMNTVEPAPAYADLQEALIITGVVTGVYVGTILLGTEAYRRKWGPFELASQDAGVRRKQHARGLRLGPHCPQRSAELTLLCW